MISSRAAVAPAEVAGHYDDLDLFYRRIWGEHVHHGFWVTGRESVPEAVEHLTDRVGDALEISPGDRVVDIGCGYGSTARRLVARSGAEVTGITLSRVQYEYARQCDLASTNPDFHLGDWLANDFPSASFDAALAIESTEHMEDKRGAFREIARVLRPGGRMAVCAWIAAESPRSWEVRHLLEPICREGRLPGMGSQADYEEMIRAAGLRLDNVADWTEAVSPTWGRCLRMAIRRLAGDRVTRDAFLRTRTPDRIFLLTVARIWAAYRRGAMRYLLFVAVKDEKR